MGEEIKRQKLPGNALSGARREREGGRVNCVDPTHPPRAPAQAPAGLRWLLALPGQSLVFYDGLGLGGGS